MLTVEQCYARCEQRGLNPQWNGKGGFACFCPAHGDTKTRHLYIKPGYKALVCWCAHGCGFTEIAAALGMERREWQAPDPTRRLNDGSVTHDYRDAMGRLVYQTWRKGSGKGKQVRRRRPDPSRPGEWIWNLSGVELILYRLPEIVHADPTAVVLLGEGEKVADVLARTGNPATTNVGGAKQWKDHYADTLIGRRVAVFPDQDADGEFWTAEVTASLTKRAIPFGVVRLEGLSEGQDAYDWIRAGHEAAELLALAEEAVGSVRWEPPLALSWADLPGFPVEALPEWLGRMVLAVAMSLQVPVDVPAIFGLSLLAVGCQKRLVVKVRDDWEEPLAFWGLIVQPPGHRKSQTLSTMKKPVTEYEEELIGLSAPEIAASQMEQRIKQGQLKRAEDEAIKAKDEFQRHSATQRAKELAVELETWRPVSKPRLIVDDCTPEKLSMLLSENGGRMAVLSAEGGVFDIMAGKYASGAANLDLYLAGHSGDDYISDRVGRASIVIRQAALTFGLTVQPDVLQGFAGKPNFKGRGLLGRFAYAIPISLLGRREVTAPGVPAAVREDYERALKCVLGLPADTDAEGRPTPQVLTLDDEAREEVEAALGWIEPRLGVLGDLHHMTDWAGKAVGQMVRIAGLLHVAELAGYAEPWLIPVNRMTMRGARAVLEYLIPHAQAAYRAMGADEAMRGAHHILEWLQGKGVPWFTRRALQRRLVATFPRIEDVEEPLKRLEEHGWIRRRPEPKHPGPPTVSYEVHPALVTTTEGLRE